MNTQIVMIILKVFKQESARKHLRQNKRNGGYFARKTLRIKCTVFGRSAITFSNPNQKQSISRKENAHLLKIGRWTARNKICCARYTHLFFKFCLGQ